MTQSSPEKQSFRTGSARSSGFTLVEILIVLAIIAALSAIAFPAYQSYIDKAKRTVSIGTLESLRKAMEVYHIQYAKYPPLLDTVSGLDGQGNVVLESQLLEDFKKNVFTLESYTLTSSGYTVTVKVMDSARTLYTLSPNTIVTQGP